MQEAEGSDPDDSGASSVFVAGRRCLQLLLWMQMRSEMVHLPNRLPGRPRHPGPQPGGALSLLSSVTQPGLLLQLTCLGESCQCLSEVTAVFA